MASETVQAVRQAEISAATIEKDAHKEKEIIIEQARHDGQEMITSLTRDARVKGEKAYENAIERGEELIETMKQNAEKEVLLMREMASQKERTAIDLVLSTVV